MAAENDEAANAAVEEGARFNEAAAHGRGKPQTTSRFAGGRARLQ